MTMLLDHDDVDAVLTAVRAAADGHGDAEGAEVEIGDWMGLFGAAYRRLAPEARRDFWRDEAIVDLLEVPEYAPLRPLAGPPPE